MGVNESKPKALRRDVAVCLHELLAGVVSHSKLLQPKALHAFAVEVASHATADCPSASSCWRSSSTASGPCFLCIRLVASEISSLLDRVSISDLLVVCKQAKALYYRPSLSKAASDAAIKIWPGMLGSREASKALHKALRTVPAHHWRSTFVELLTSMLGSIAAIALRKRAEAAIERQIHSILHQCYDKRRPCFQRWLLGSELSHGSVKRMKREAIKVSPFMLAAAAQGQARLTLLAVSSGQLDATACLKKQMQWGVSSECFAAITCPSECTLNSILSCSFYKPHLEKLDLSLRPDIWRESWHPSPRSSFHDPQCFPYLHSLINRFRAELVQEFDMLWTHSRGAFRKWESNNQWLLLGTHLFGSRIEDCASAAPWAAWIAESLGATICGYSVLLPGAWIKPHSEDGESASLRAHVGLRVPRAGGYGLRVQQQVSVWTEDSLFLFESTSVHEAWNFTDELRAVLLLDFGAGALPVERWPKWVVPVLQEQQDFLQRCSPTISGDSVPPSVMKLDFPCGLEVEAQVGTNLHTGSTSVRAYVCGHHASPLGPPQLQVWFPSLGSASRVQPDCVQRLSDEEQRFRAKLKGEHSGVSCCVIVHTVLTAEGVGIQCCVDHTGVCLYHFLVEASSLQWRAANEICWEERQAREMWTLTFFHADGAGLTWAWCQELEPQPAQ